MKILIKLVIFSCLIFNTSHGERDPVDAISSMIDMMHERHRVKIVLQVPMNDTFLIELAERIMKISTSPMRILRV